MSTLIWMIAASLIGCGAFAALGIWAAVTDEGHRRQRALARAEQ